MPIAECSLPFLHWKKDTEAQEKLSHQPSHTAASLQTQDQVPGNLVSMPGCGLIT